MTDILQKLKETKLATADISQQDFDAIAGHLEKEEIDAALQLIHTAFDEGNFDMRLIAYHFYAGFLKSGFKSFNVAFPSLMSLIQDHWEALRPVHRKEKQIENSFNWFFTHVINKLKYNDRLRKENKPLLWPADVLRMPEEEFVQLGQVISTFSDFFHQRWSQSSGKERVGHLLKKLAELKPLLVPEEKEQDEIVQEAPAKEEAAIPVAQQNFFETPAMLQLIKKLKTFEQLAEKRQFLKAALVSSDLSQILASFDPSFYFPKLFSTYFNLLARHSSSIAELSENQESLEWKALERLYKTDLDQFTQW